MTVPFIGRAPPMRHWKQTRNQAAVLRRKIERQIETDSVSSGAGGAVSTDCKRARADQSASSTALWLDRLGFVRLRRRQLLRRRALDLLPAPRVDDDSTESNLHLAAVGIGRSERLGQKNQRPGNGDFDRSPPALHPPFLAPSEGVSFACCLLFVLMDLPLAKCIRSLSMSVGMSAECQSRTPMQRSKYQLLFDHVVGAGEKRRRHGQADCVICLS